MRSARVLFFSVVTLAASCGGKVLVDGLPVSGGGGGNKGGGGGAGGAGGAGGSSEFVVATTTAAVTGSTGTGMSTGAVGTTGTTGAGGLVCDPEGCTSDGKTCTCKTTCNKHAFAVQCTAQGAVNVACTCLKDGTAISKCAAPSLECSVTGGCCASVFF